MVDPSIFVHPFGELRKHFHVLRTEVELPFGSAKVEALVFPQFAGFIFAAVAAPFRFFQLPPSFPPPGGFPAPPHNQLTRFHRPAPPPARSPTAAPPPPSPRQHPRRGLSPRTLS